MLFVLSSNPPPKIATNLQSGAPQTQTTPTAKQLLAVRGVITKKKVIGKGLLQLTVKPAKDFAEVTVVARENDLVGNASSRASDSDASGLLGSEASGNEMITAAELDEGDIVSVIYDPQAQNRVLEIYLH